jgi:predicted HTH domain antitoxin
VVYFRGKILQGLCPGRHRFEACHVRRVSHSGSATFAGERIKPASREFLVEILERGLRELKIECALERYSQGKLSFGATARQAGVSQSELARYAYAHGMEPTFTDETVAEELSSRVGGSMRRDPRSSARGDLVQPLSGANHHGL